MGLRWVIQMPHIRANHRLLTAVAEWWHSENNTFHLTTREALITLEDVYRILQVLCYGELVSGLFDCSCNILQILMREILMLSSVMSQVYYD